MELIHSVALGVIQGLTEFLPISSSGHLVLFQSLFGFTEPELLFDISVHVGTLLAVCAVFFSDIRRMTFALVKLPFQREGSFGAPIRTEKDRSDLRVALMIVVGNVPTAAIGFFFHQSADRIFGSTLLVGVMLLVTGAMLWMTRRTGKMERDIHDFRVSDAVVIGLLQGLAILPGISRSGATISAALFLGINRELAGRFSFLLSVPAIAGALMLHLREGPSLAQTSLPVIATGAVIAGLTGYAALKYLLKVVQGGHLHRFAPYCWLLGIAVLFWSAA